MVSLSVWLFRERLIADQARSRSGVRWICRLCPDCDLPGSQKPRPLSQIGTAGTRAKAIKDQGNQKTRQSKNKTIKNPAHGKRGRGFWGRVNAPLRTAPPRQRLIERVDLA